VKESHPIEVVEFAVARGIDAASLPLLETTLSRRELASSQR
jgi:hypothetical protein